MIYAVYLNGHIHTSERLNFIITYFINYYNNKTLKESNCRFRQLDFMYFYLILTNHILIEIYNADNV